MPILDKPISRAEYYSRQYDKLTPSQKKALKEQLELQRKGYDTSNIAYDESGKGYSISPEELNKKQPTEYEGTYKDSSGKGFSERPETVPVSIKRGAYGTSTITFASGRKERPYLDTVNIYGSEQSPQYRSRTSKIVSTYNAVKERLRDRFPVTADILKFERSIPSRVKKASQEGGVSVMNFASIVFRNRALTSGEESKVRKVVGGVFEGNKLVSSAYYGGKYGAELISKSPKALRVVSNRPVSYGLTGLYVYGKGKEIIRSDNKVLTATKAATEYYAFSKGISASKGLRREIFKYNSGKKVERVEGFKVDTRSVTFNDLTATKYYGRDVLISGRQKSQGAGLFKVGSKYYRTTFKEKGMIKKSDGSVFTRSTATLKIQPYTYGITGKRYPSGVLKTARMSSEQVLFPTKNDGVFAIRGLSKIRIKGTPQITRLTTAKAVSNGFKTGITGLNVDAYRGVVLKGTAKNIKGFSENVLSTEQSGLTYAVDKGYIFGRNSASSSSVLRDVGSNVKSFRRREFVSGANSLVYSGRSTPNVQVSISESSIKGLISKQYAVDTSKSQLGMIRYTPKTITVKQSNTQSTKSSSTKYVGVGTAAVYKPVVSLTPTGLKLQPVSLKGIVSKSNSRIIPVQRGITRVSTNSILRQSNIPISQSKSMTKSRQTTNTLSLRGILSRQVVQSKAFTTINIPKIVVPITPMTDRNRKPYIKSLGSYNFGSGMVGSRYKYIPSIQSKIFNIKGTISKTSAQSGLIIRPVVV